MGRSVRLLVVDDEEHVRQALAAWLRDEGYQVSTAANADQALRQMSSGQGGGGADILLVDIRLPDMNGLELQQRIQAISADATVILMTAYATVETAVQALKQGAYDYVIKPFDPEQISRLVQKAAERYSLLTENRELRDQLRANEPTLVFGHDGPMQQVVEQIEQVAGTDTHVLITGESGTGKEVAARLIHARSRRSHRALVSVNCGALAEGVLESELFGHERGAFTGAVARRRGKVELAEGGTLFLDEIGDIPPKVQVDLLRVLEERVVTRVGGNATIPVDFRLVTATHRDLRQEIQAGRFRADLFFRINVFGLELPPLRQRPGDIIRLATHFRERFAQQMNRRITDFTPEALVALQSYGWPGNVRELQNAIERAVVVCRGTMIGREHFPFGAPLPGGAQRVETEDLTLAGVERRHIEQVLRSSSFNISQAAKLLGIDRVTLYNKMRRYGIERPNEAE